MTAMPPIRVLVSDDDRGIRILVRRALEGHGDITIVAEAANGNEAVARACEHEPDVIVMDYEMPELNGIEATAKIMPALPATKILIFTASPRQQVIDAAFAAGAVGYLNKNSSHELAQAIRGAMQGRFFVSG
jgi:DNA-binding NarL/FixJ family response regulator